MKLKSNRCLDRARMMALITLCSLLVVAGAVPASEIAPEWTLKDADGAIVSFHHDSTGRPAVLLFWATWCPYCRALMPHLENVRQEFAASGVDFYALNIWEDADPVAYMQNNGYGFHLLLDADKVALDYGIKGTPGLVVTDKAKRIIYLRKSGVSATQVAQNLRSILVNLNRTNEVIESLSDSG